MTRSLTKLLLEDVIEWPDGQRAKVIWVSEDGERFRVAGLTDAAACDGQLSGGQERAIGSSGLKRAGDRRVAGSLNFTSCAVLGPSGAAAGHASALPTPQLDD